MPHCVVGDSVGEFGRFATVQGGRRPPLRTTPIQRVCGNIGPNSLKFLFITDVDGGVFGTT